MTSILEECETGIKPLFHIEIHGEKFGKGFVLKNGDLISLSLIGEQFRKINIACGCNLFVTLGVCKGLNILLNMEMDKPMPFIGAIGSFCDIYEDDLTIRYYAFYDTFFSSFDIAKSFNSLSIANPEIPSTYQYISADELFYKSYSKYLRNKCNPEALKDRAISCMPSSATTRQLRRKFVRDFIKEEQHNRLSFFQEHTKSFFMIDRFPENKTRFHVPINFKGLENRYKK